jgi:hypothetical protein
MSRVDAVYWRVREEHTDGSVWKAGGVREVWIAPMRTVRAAARRILSGGRSGRHDTTTRPRWHL